mgnify:FL=1
MLSLDVRLELEGVRLEFLLEMSEHPFGICRPTELGDDLVGTVRSDENDLCSNFHLFPLMFATATLCSISSHRSISRRSIGPIGPTVSTSLARKRIIIRMLSAFMLFPLSLVWSRVLDRT